jgi:PTH1 family peptidyl-tRNA hydrolase
MSNRYLLVGLGNPGPRYEGNRHNVGWHVLDELARRHQLSFDKSEKSASTASGQIAGKAVLLVKPQTFMNESGVAVRALVDFYKVDLDKLLLIHDELDIPRATLRLRKTGGAGGQGGMKSVIQHLGTREFDRLRVGIGRPPGKMDPAAYVLQDFKADEIDLIREMVSRAADAVESWLKEGMDAAMTRFNGDVRPVAAEPEPDPQADLEKYIRAHELAASQPGPIEQIIATLKRLGRLDEAVEWHLKLAAIYEAKGTGLKAITERERAASIDPAQIDLHRKIAADYVAAENPKKAVQRLLILTDYFMSQGKVDEAVEAVDQALAVNPQHPKAVAISKALRARAE